MGDSSFFIFWVFLTDLISYTVDLLGDLDGKLILNKEFKYVFKINKFE